MFTLYYERNVELKSDYMPGGDRTGPRGKGSRTGRGKGLCGGNARPGFYDEENRRHVARKNVTPHEGRRSGYGHHRGHGFERD